METGLIVYSFAIDLTPPFAMDKLVSKIRYMSCSHDQRTAHQTIVNESDSNKKETLIQWLHNYHTTPAYSKIEKLPPVSNPNTIRLILHMYRLSNEPINHFSLNNISQIQIIDGKDVSYKTFDFFENKEQTLQEVTHHINQLKATKAI